MCPISLILKDILDKKAEPTGGVTQGIQTSERVEVKKGTIAKQEVLFFLKKFLFKQPVGVK